VEGAAVSNDPSEFADKLRRIDNEHEVMIAYRDEGAAPQDPAFIASVVDDSLSAVAPSFAAQAGSGRSGGGFASASAEARDRLLDFLEVNRRRPVYLDADPVGSNPSDIKHDFHNVLAAWDSRRGEGVEVSVMDSGLSSTSFDTSSVHEDAQDFSDSGYGVVPKGFVDDYGVNCFQPEGSCPFRDTS